jgi:hypothetical protein
MILKQTHGRTKHTARPSKTNKLKIWETSGPWRLLGRGGGPPTKQKHRENPKKLMKP